MLKCYILGTQILSNVYPTNLRIKHFPTYTVYMLKSSHIHKELPEMLQADVHMILILVDPGAMVVVYSIIYSYISSYAFVNNTICSKVVINHAWNT